MMVRFTVLGSSAAAFTAQVGVLGSIDFSHTALTDLL